MKYCKHCGKEIMDEAVICPNCGCAVEEPAVTKIKDDDFATVLDVVIKVFLILG